MNVITRTMQTNVFKRTALAAATCTGLVLVLLTSSAAAAGTVIVSPYDNLSKTSTSYLLASASGLEPNTNVSITQVSFAPMSKADGDTGHGIKTEEAFVGNFPVNMYGNAFEFPSVNYDIVPNGPVNINYCDNNPTLDRVCLLRFTYVDGPLIGQIAFEQKLYFGMKAPTVDPTPSGPLTSDQCKNDGWKNFDFKNQGDCVSYVTHL